MSTIVEVHQLTKMYRDVTAVSEVTFSMEPEKIYGLLGRNGAGKTTLMQMLAAHVFATSGEVRIFGQHPYENNRVLSQLCFIKESQKYPETFCVADVLDLCASFFPRWDRAYASSLSEDFQLPLKRRMKALSRGMLSSVGCVIGLASRAPLTLFDEPYLGLDAVARSMFYEHVLADYAEHPRTIVLSTHLIDEVSRLLEHVIVIDDGKLIIDEDTDALHGRAYTVVGPLAKVETFIVGKEVIDRQLLGALTSVTVLGPIPSEDKRQAEALGLEIAAVSLQQLIVHLTGKASSRKAAPVL